MKIRLKDASVIIEIFEDSQYVDYISNNLKKLYDYSWQNDKLIIPYRENQQIKRELILKSIYYLCVSRVKYENPIFLENLMKASSKRIEMIIKSKNNITNEEFARYYMLLNSNKSDSLKSIKKKYHKLVKIYHPDRVATKSEKLIEQYTNKFQQIQEAYEVIKFQMAS